MCCGSGKKGWEGVWVHPGQGVPDLCGNTISGYLVFWIRSTEQLVESKRNNTHEASGWGLEKYQSFFLEYLSRYASPTSSPSFLITSTVALVNRWTHKTCTSISQGMKRYFPLSHEPLNSFKNPAINMYWPEDNLTYWHLGSLNAHKSCL
jgi:hypothetical protein